MEHIFILSLLLVALILFATEWVRSDIVAIGVAVVLMVTGTVDIEAGFSGFSNPAVITVIAMFILSSGLVRTGVAEYIGELMVKVSGSSPVLMTIVVMLVVGVMSAFMNNIGATAILITSVFAMARKMSYPSGKLLMPLSFGSLLGGLTTLIGTPPNLLVSAALMDYDFEGFNIFDFLPTGLAVLGTGMLYMATVGKYLIPVRKDDDDLAGGYHLDEYISEVSIPEGSSFAETTIRESGLKEEYGLIVLKIRRKRDQDEMNINPDPSVVLKEGDILVVEGNVEEFLQVKKDKHLDIHIERKVNEGKLTDDADNMAEVAIAPNSNILGQTIKQADIRRRFGVLAIALHRRGHTFRRNYATIPLQVGDVILIQGSEQALSSLSANRNFLVINRLDKEPPQTHKAPYAIGIMGLVVLLAATGLLHISLAGFTGVVLMVLFGCIKPENIYRDVEWRVIFLIAGLMPLGIAMDSEHTGTAGWIAGLVTDYVGAYGPWVVMAALFVLTSILTGIMSNAATAVLLAPIAITIAIDMGIEPYAFLMTIAISASASFITPVGHQSNVLIYGLGGYRFLDFARVGGPLTLVIFLVTMLVVPVIWPFTPM